MSICTKLHKNRCFHELFNILNKGEVKQVPEKVTESDRPKQNNTIFVYSTNRNPALLSSDQIRIMCPGGRRGPGPERQ